MRINKYIASCGICSRRKAEDLVKQGLIKVNGVIINDLATRIDSEKDYVEYKDKRIKLVEKKYYLMLNKPTGYTSTNKDKYAEKTIFELVNIDARLFSIGRLDKDSSGLILITNDGDIYNKVMHPINQVFKKYYVEIDKSINKSDKNQLENGVNIGNYITQPALVKQLTPTSLNISISEGKNRQVRRMFASLGYEVKTLHRLEIGEIKLGNLKEGQIRNLSQRDIKYLKELDN